MNYREIISWAEDKIENEKKTKAFDIEVDENFPIRIFNESNDAVRELVLETCDTTTRTPMCEINVLNNEDMLILKKKYDNLKSNHEALIELLKVAYNNPNKFSEVVYRKMSKMKSFDIANYDFVDWLKSIH